MWIYRRIAFLFLAIAVATAPFAAQRKTGEERPVIRVALLEDGPESNRPVDIEELRRELSVLTSGAFDLRFPAQFHWVGDGTQVAIGQALDSLLAQDGVDLLIATGPIASDGLCRRNELPVPAFAMSVIDAELQSAPFRGPGSGIPNLSYLTAPLHLTRDLEAYRELVPFQKVTLLMGAELSRALPGLVEGIVSAVPEVDIEVQLMPLDGTAESIFAGLRDDCEAVWFAPLPHLVRGAFDSLVIKLSLKGLPTFSLIGADDVRRGLFASMAPENGAKQLVTRTALNVYRVLQGEHARDLPSVITGPIQLTVNARTAQVIGVWPSFGVLTEVELVGEVPPDDERELSLPLVMRAVMGVDRNLLAAEQELRAAEEGVVQAGSSLLPQLDLAASWSVTDDKQASLGRAERMLSGRLSGSQVLWSESLRAGLDIEERQQESRELEFEVRVLDVVESVAIVYLGVLRAESLARIRRDDLRVTRSNLELAQIRRELGIDGAAEVYRWESRISTGRSAVLDARAKLKVARLELNHALFLPLEQPFRLVEVEHSDPELLIDPRIVRFIDNPRGFELLREFQVREGVAAAPELASLDRAISAQERTLTSARRAHWQPNLSLDGSLQDVFEASGSGSQIPPGFVGVIPDPENTTWNASLIGSFSLFTGGAKQSRERQARHRLVMLRFQREALSRQIELRIRVQLQTAVASYATIQLARDAAASADKNLELVRDSYSRGVVSIVELLDAQNAALVADEVAADAVHDFAVDMISVQRAVGQFSLFLADGERDRWFGRLEQFEMAHRNSSAGKASHIVRDWPSK